LKRIASKKKETGTPFDIELVQRDTTKASREDVAAGTNEEESSSSLVPELFSLVMSECNASGRARLIPIPIAAVLGFFGIIATSRFD
jgi:hypothetical protein